MLDIKLAKLVKKAINEKVSSKGEEVVRIEDVCKMSPVSGNGYVVLAHQYGDMTILVWIFCNSKTGEYEVARVKTVAW